MLVADARYTMNLLGTSSVPNGTCENSYDLFLTINSFFFRFIAGVAVGGVFTILPIYVGEISEPSNRGALSSSMGCFCCLGLLLPCSMGPFMNIKLFSSILATLPVLFLISFGILAPETPLYLMQQGDENMARAALEKLRTNKNAVERDMVELQSMEKEHDSRGWSEIYK